MPVDFHKTAIPNATNVRTTIFRREIIIPKVHKDTDKTTEPIIIITLKTAVTTTTQMITTVAATITNQTTRTAAITTRTKADTITMLIRLRTITHAQIMKIQIAPRTNPDKLNAANKARQAC